MKSGVVDTDPLMTVPTLRWVETHFRLDTVDTQMCIHLCTDN